MKSMWMAKIQAQEFIELRGGGGGPETCSWDEEGRGGLEGLPSLALCVSVCVSVCVWVCVCQLSRAAGERCCCWAQAGTVRGATAAESTRPHGGDMFDNAHYPFNCFNYDGDGYPSSSTDEDKKMCRPAYRYRGIHFSFLSSVTFAEPLLYLHFTSPHFTH